jgi:cob(I)alamin adenosyltransferase
MKIYTRTGDSGETDLFGGGRLAKDAPRIETCGAVDELNALLGLVRAGPLPHDVDLLLERIQNELFELGSEIASPEREDQRDCSIASEHVLPMEADIDRLATGLEPLSQFILPAGVRAAAELHLARTVCRRAERRLVAAFRQDQEKISQMPLVYLIRLSDLLFVLARRVNSEAGHPDVLWKKPD